MKDSKYIDHTLLKATATKEEIEKLCDEAILHDFKSVCVNPVYVQECSEKLKDSDVLVCTVVGFPLGQNTTKVKVLETKDALANGAQEIDMVINVAKVKDNDYKYVKQEIKKIKKVCSDVILKVIIETCYLTKEEIKKVTQIAIQAGCDFVKTSTGFGTGGANEQDVKLMKSVCKDKAQVKASGGVKTKEDFEKMKEAGATRIGTSSGVNLVGGKNESTNAAY